MGTISEEILSKKINREVVAGDIIVTDVDYVLSHDTTTPLAIKALEAMRKKVWQPDKSVIVFDHIYPPASVKSAILQKSIRAFIKEEKIKNFHRGGISHQLMVENYTIPGNVIVGADSHTCTHGALGCFSTGMGSTDIAVALATGKAWLKVPETIHIISEGEFTSGVFTKDLILNIVGKVGAEGANYNAIEYSGETIKEMSINERLTMTNMAVEMGAKTGLIQADNKTMEYTGGKGFIVEPVDPIYRRTIDFNVDDLVPKIAVPHRVDNIFDVEDFEGMGLDQIFVGTCTNGRISDLEIVAKILKNESVHPDVRMVLVPASQRVMKEAQSRGYIDIFHDAGVIVGNPGCGPCIGRHQGVLAPGEKALTTMNRNFMGRMGSPDAEIYLSSPATAAYSAIKGKLSDPRENKLEVLI